MKRNKGITLIALIITIIVMLILVAVSISVALNTGLFKSASDATKNWKSAQDTESKMQIEIGGKKYDSIEDYLEGKEAIQEIHNWVRTGDTLTCGHCNRTVTIGQQLNYTKTGTGTSKISGDMSGVSQGITDANLTASDFGTRGEQTISKDSETKWVVLGAEDSNNSGTNETLLLTTKEPTTDTIGLYGAAPYNNCIDEINRMCKELYGADARGMTIEDVSNCLGYTAPAGICRKIDPTTDELTYYTVPEGTKISELGSSYGNIWEDIQNNTYTEEDGTKKYFTPSCPEGTKDASVLGNEIVNASHYSVSDDGTYLVNEANRSDTSHTITTVTKTLIFGTDNSYLYWLASRGVDADTYCASFGPGSVYRGNAYSCFGLLFCSFDYSRFEVHALRAVVSLRSDIPAVVE